MPEPAGAQAQAVVANGFVYTSVRIAGGDGTGGAPGAGPAGFQDQVRQVLADLAAVLADAGSSLAHVVKVTTFLAEPRLADYNRVYAEVFGTNLPARTTVTVEPSGSVLELSCIAVTEAQDRSAPLRRIPNAPGMAPVLGPYSQAVVANGFVFTSGQIPAVTSMADQPAEFGGKVRQVLANLETVLLEAGSGLQHIAKVTTYLTDPDQLEEYNAVYGEVFGSQLPARTSCCVGIWDIALEIECVAVVAGSGGPGFESTEAGSLPKERVDA
ncbi:MAG TPA: RidA family protein [Micrococcaceae bacterium]